MARINAYLNFAGNTEDAMNFYKSVFGGEFTVLQRFGEIPGGEKMSDEDQGKIMNISLPMGWLSRCSFSREPMGPSLGGVKSRSSQVTPAEKSPLESGMIHDHQPRPMR